MTQLLVSVRSLEEALLAADAGVAVIDLKEPRRGSLGRVSEAVAKQVSDAVTTRTTLSMALGELAQWTADDWQLIRSLPPGIRFAKIGLAGCESNANWRAAWHEAVHLLPRHCDSVAVIYADWQHAAAPPPTAVLDEAVNNNCRAVLIDTSSKQSGNVFAHGSATELAEWFRRARTSAMLTVLAGSLGLDDLPAALALAPDYIAVRGAVCRDSRQSDLSPTKLADWVQRLAAVA